MDPVVSLGLLAVGAVALFLGSKWLVDGSTALALRYGVRPLVIGLTIVALGTSSPEAVLAFFTSLEGNNQLSLGNVIGANISVAALILGVGCLMGPLALKLNRMWRESAFLLLSGPLLAFLAWDGRLDLFDGVIMFIVLSGFFYVLYSAACRGETCAVVEEELEVVSDVGRMSFNRTIALIVAGSALLAVGAQAVIEGASGLAATLGVGEQIIGLTLVAIGTTIPELTVTITASRKRQSDVVLGNVVGTIIVNTLFILGLGAIVGGYDTTASATWVGMAIMISLSTLVVLLLAFLDRGWRRTGLMMLSLYALYIAVVALFLG
ncbi:MAG: sodium:calcium antiporter [Methanomassiliicoccus sp.]|nr:sodium:calcium antiporter [Methanomassiliicoccus sp.]